MLNPGWAARFVLSLAGFLLALGAGAQAPTRPAPATAFHYGSDPPIDELAAFDWVVLEPGHGHDIAAIAALHPRTTWLAYLAVGEVRGDHGYRDLLPVAWRAGRNAAWASEVIDPAAPEWPQWFIDHVARPQWERGYRGFFLDALDSYQLLEGDGAKKAARREGLVRLIVALRKAFPTAKLAINRGFELLPDVAPLVDLVVAESLLRRWNPVTQRYEDVPDADHHWLLDQLRRVQGEFRLPVLAIDYAAPAERAVARETARRIEALGVAAYVANASHDQVGIGALEVLPRRVLVLHDSPVQRPSDLTMAGAHRFVDLPLDQLGLIPVHLQVDQDRLPEHPLAGRYAGVVTLFQRETTRPALAAFLRRAIDEGVRVASLGQPGLGAGSDLRDTYGLRLAAGVPRGPIAVAERAPEVGFETEPTPNLQTFRPYTAPDGSRVLLRLRDAGGATMDAAAETAWGGYLTWGHGLVPLAHRPGDVRWLVDPIAFLRRALAVPDMPVPDTTTESGRRMLIAHVDGDGFANASDQRGAPLASEVLLTDVLERYRVPTTVSVIEGELSPQGLYAARSAEMEGIARRMFALPHVEVASHSYSHPFRWEAAAAGQAGYTLAMPGYTFDLDREVAGSIRYIESRLTPPGKPVRLFHWSGDTNPGEAALAAVRRAGIDSINGGNTLIARANASLTRVAPLGLQKGRHFQVYAPNQNENVYTNGFTAPLYGYERVIEAFELTESPYRLKPINLYFHTYAASRRASLAALHKAWRWALQQPVHPVFASAYVAKAQDFNRIVIARRAGGFQVRGAAALRQLRAPAALGHPDVGNSAGLAGHRPAAGNETYLHLSADEALLRFAARPDDVPNLFDANGRVEAFERAGASTVRMRLAAQVPLNLTVRHRADCRVDADGTVLTATGRSEDRSTYALDRHGPATLTIACR